VDIGGLHVASACAGLCVGLMVLLRGKGGAWHVVLGRLFLPSMVLLNVPVLLLYEDSGRPGPFHVLAVVSLVTTTLVWPFLRGRLRGRRAIAGHASFMTWSWIGAATAGLARLGNRQLPEQSPWPVVAVVGVVTGIGLVGPALRVPPTECAPAAERGSGGRQAWSRPGDVDGLDVRVCSRLRGDRTDEDRSCLSLVSSARPAQAR
jgi:uncharacterized membrane protein